MDNQHPGGNTGFIEVEPAPSDFIAGGETGILATPVLPSEDWRPFLPTNQCQLMLNAGGTSLGDTNACVSFAGKQDVETILNFQIKEEVVSADNIAWLKSNGFIDGNGSVFLSARFLAKMSGTTPSQGNSLPKVWASLANDGAVPESLWPMPAFAGLTTQQEGWDLYYAEVPAAVIELGKQFAARFPILYEWMIFPGNDASGSAVLADLSVAPLEIATAVCNGWNTEDPILGCGPGAQHATLLTFVEENGDYDILDHYVPWQKQFSPDYSITYGMRGVVGQAIVPAPVGFKYTFTKQLTFQGAQNDPTELHALQEALQWLKSKKGAPYMTAGVFGPFGPLTKAALGAFQTDHGIHDIDGQGADFGPSTRAAVNAALVVAH